MILLKSRSNILLLTASIFVTLAGAEIYLRVNPPILVYMSTRNIVQHTHSEVSPNPWIAYVPRAGIEKPFRNREFNTRVKINSVNMRDREYALRKPEGMKRIAVMGDSFVFGWGVENDEIFTEILESQLKNTEVLNFGVAGYAAFRQLERLKIDALKFQPDIVLFFLYGWPDPRPKTPDRYEDRGGLLFSLDDPRPSLKAKIAFLLERNLYLFTLYQEFRGTLRKEEPLPEHIQESFGDLKSGLNILKEFKELSEQKSFTPYVIYVPVKQSVEQGIQEPESKEVAQFCQTQGLAFLDLTGPLHQFWIREKKSPYFRIDDHWNRDGHRAAAKILKDYLAGTS